MYKFRFIQSFLLMSLLCSCGSETWFGKEKILNMPGERVPLVARSKDLVVDEKSKNISIPNSITNTKWNGYYNQFSNHHSNLSWKTNSSFSTAIGFSKPSFLVQTSIPCIQDDKLYTISIDGAIHAYDVNSGSELWVNAFFSQEENRGFLDFFFNKFLAGGIKKEGNTLYVTAGLAKVLALDSTTGEILWDATFSSPIRSIPLVVDDLVIFQSIDNKIYALDKTNGASVWTHFANFEDLSSLAVFTPLEFDRFIIAKFNHDEVVALDKQTGEELWSNGLVSQQRFGLVARSSFNSNSSFHLGENYLVTSNSKGHIFKIDLQTGTILWDKDIAATGKSWLVGNYLFFISTSNDLIALDMHSGKVAWILNLNRQSPDGKLVSDLYISNPVVANNHVYVLNNKGELFQIDVTDGKMIDTLSIPKDAYLGPIFANDHMFVISNNGILSIF